MTPKRKAFVSAYARHLNSGLSNEDASKKAALEVGFARSRLREQVARLLGSPDVAAAIEQARSQPVQEPSLLRKRGRPRKDASQPSEGAQKRVSKPSVPGPGRVRNKTAFLAKAEAMIEDPTLTPSARMKALELIGKVLGLYKPTTFSPRDAADEEANTDDRKTRSLKRNRYDRRETADTPPHEPKEEMGGIGALMSKQTKGLH